MRYVKEATLASWWHPSCSRKPVNKAFLPPNFLSNPGQQPAIDTVATWESADMKVATLFATALTAAASVTAISVSLPRDTTNGLTQSPELAELLESAKSTVIDQVTAEERKLRARGVTPTCTAKKLVFRRE